MSAFDPFDPALFSMTAGCLPCCAPPGECACAMLIPPFTSPYADYATALAVVSNPLLVSNCIGYYPGSDPSPTVFDVDFDGTAVAVECTSAADASSEFSLSILSGETISAAYSRSTSGGGGGFVLYGVGMSIYDCTGTLVDSKVAYTTSPTGSGTLTSIAMPRTDVYYVVLSSGMLIGDNPPSSEHNEFSVTSSGAIVTNPVIALYDDSGTTRQLEACPKLLLPILTENTGTWYADCASASSDLTNALIVSNCVGYNGGAAIPGTSFTATDGGSSLTLAVSAGMFPLLSVGPLWGSVNCEAGQTISVAWAASGTATVLIYDYTGALIDTLSSASSPLTSSALPYTGRYTVKYSLFFSTPIFSDSAVITSSGVLSVNPIQALYDTGLDCPARLNCGDSC